jgi:hypothetical protein
LEKKLDTQPVRPPTTTAPNGVSFMLSHPALNLINTCADIHKSMNQIDGKNTILIIGEITLLDK